MNKTPIATWISALAVVAALVLQLVAFGYTRFSSDEVAILRVSCDPTCTVFWTLSVDMVQLKVRQHARDPNAVFDRDREFRFHFSRER